MMSENRLIHPSTLRCVQILLETVQRCRRCHASCTRTRAHPYSIDPNCTQTRIAAADGIQEWRRPDAHKTPELRMISENSSKASLIRSPEHVLRLRHDNKRSGIGRKCPYFRCYTSSFASFQHSQAEVLRHCKVFARARA